jgi:hypothetical protein
MVSTARIFPIPISFSRVARSILDCAHRATTIHLIDPSKLARYLFKDGD